MFQPTPLCENGPIFSRLVWGVMSWGAWGKRLSPQQMLRLIELGVECGVTTFDHADIYGGYTTEAEFGRALSLQPGLREKIQLVSKCNIRLVSEHRPHHKLKSYDSSIEHILWSVDRSLQNLQTDYLDLLLIHRSDPLLIADDVAEVFRYLQKQGKVLHFGVSNFSPSQFDLLHSRYPLVTHQVAAGILHLDPFFDGTFDQAQRLRFRPMAWSPFGGGQLFRTGPESRVSRLFSNKTDPRASRIRNAAHWLADRREGVTWDQMVLAWLLFHPAGILPVLGTTNPARIDRALAAARIQMTREEWFELLEAARGREVE